MIRVMILGMLVAVWGIPGYAQAMGAATGDGRPAAIAPSDRLRDAPVGKSPPIAFPLPSRPAQLAQVEHRFYDRPAKLELLAWAAVGGTDIAQTCRFMARGYGDEWMPARTCGQTAMIGVGAIALVELTSLALHRHGHHRWERVPRLLAIGGNVSGLVTSKRNGTL